MKKLSIFVIAVLTGCLSFAQNNTRSQQTFLCSYYGEKVSLPVTVINSSADAQRAISAITYIIGVEGNFEIREANIPNAAAIIYNNKRFILYNPTFINQINNAAGDKWAAIAILAHEIGHHLDGHTLSGSGSHPETELEADEFSGFVLRKMGASLAQAQSAMRLVANERSTETHPAKALRLTSIDNGWAKADAQLSGGKYIAKAMPRVYENDEEDDNSSLRTSNKTTTTLNAAYINFRVYFTNGAGNEFYITKDNRFVSISNGNVVTLGRMVRSQSQDYPLGIRLSDNGYFWISRDGELMNKNGVRVGYLKG